MPYFFTKTSYARFSKKLEEQQKAVKAVGKEMGEEAGISCDWHDNFGYEEARRRLELESKRLKEMIDIVQDSSIIDIEEQNDIVKIGCTVLFSLDSEEKEYTIGAYGETAPNIGLVSYITPIGVALFGKHVDDAATANINGKDVAIEVLEIFPPSYKYNTMEKDADHGHRI